MSKINKKNLNLFLSKINLNGLSNKILIDNTDDESFVNALDDTGNLIIKCNIKGNLFDNEEQIAIYDVQSFMRYLNLFDTDELNYKLEKNGDVNVKLLISDKNKNISYNLADKDNIPQQELKKKPEPCYTFKLTDVMSTDILKALDVSISKQINFIIKKSTLFLHIGDETAGEHIIKIKIDNAIKVKDLDIDKLSFNANFFSNILKCNSDVEIKLLDGLIIYESKSKVIETTYYQRMLISKEKN